MPPISFSLLQASFSTYDTTDRVSLSSLRFLFVCFFCITSSSGQRQAISFSRVRAEWPLDYNMVDCLDSHTPDYDSVAAATPCARCPPRPPARPRF
jgi:hypothetical protein